MWCSPCRMKCTEVSRWLPGSSLCSVLDKWAFFSVCAQTLCTLLSSCFTRGLGDLGPHSFAVPSSVHYDDGKILSINCAEKKREWCELVARRQKGYRGRECQRMEYNGNTFWNGHEIIIRCQEQDRHKEKIIVCGRMEIKNFLFFNNAFCRSFSCVVLRLRNAKK